MAYSYYVPLVVQSGQVTGTVTDFVALIDHTFAPWKSVGNGGHIINNDNGFPGDFNVYSDSGLTTALTFEMIDWDATTGAITAWVKVGSAATSTTVYIAYGNAAQIFSLSNNVSTWTGIGFVSVYHMDELFVSGTYWADFPGGYDLTNTNGTVVTGKVYDGGDFNGSSAYARFAAGIVTAPPLTLSCWINTDSIFGGQSMSAMNSSANANGFTLGDDAVNAVTFITATNGFASYGAAFAGPISTGTWYHVAGVTSGVASRYAYVDGVAGTQETTSVTPASTPNNLSVGTMFFSSTTNGFFNGRIDEARVHNVARDGAWLEAEYNSQNDAPAFWVLGSEVPVGGAVTWVGYQSPFGWN